MAVTKRRLLASAILGLVPVMAACSGDLSVSAGPPSNGPADAAPASTEAPAAHPQASVTPLDPDARFPGSIVVPAGFAPIGEPQGDTVSYIADAEQSRQSALARGALEKQSVTGAADEGVIAANEERLAELDAADAPFTASADEWVLQFVKGGGNGGPEVSFSITVTTGDIYAADLLQNPENDPRIEFTDIHGAKAMVGSMSSISYVAWQPRPGLSVFVSSDKANAELVDAVARSFVA